MAAGSTYTPIATTTLSSTSSLVTFSSIPSTYTDLVFISNAKFTAAGDFSGRLYFNNDTSSLYSTTFLFGTGSAAGSSRPADPSAGYAGRFTNEMGNGITNIMNYANTTTFKTFIDRGNNPTNLVAATVNLYRSTSAINRLDFKPDNSLVWAIGSTFTLYGIAAA
jgi:hypothetical protein